MHAVALASCHGLWTKTSKGTSPREHSASNASHRRVAQLAGSVRQEEHFRPGAVYRLSGYPLIGPSLGPDLEFQPAGFNDCTCSCKPYGRQLSPVRTAHAEHAEHARLLWQATARFAGQARSALSRRSSRSSLERKPHSLRTTTYDCVTAAREEPARSEADVKAARARPFHFNSQPRPRATGRPAGPLSLLRSIHSGLRLNSE